MVEGKYKIIIFEGPELVGKSTLKLEFEKATNFRHLCVDRMFVTSMIYNAFKGRHADLNDLIMKDFKKFVETFDPLFVYINADEDIKQKRFEKRGEWYIKPEEFKQLFNLYEITFQMLAKLHPKNIIKLMNNDQEDIYKNIVLIEQRLNIMMQE